MPLQTLFYDKVTAVGTTQLYPLGTERVEGDKIYKYFKVGDTIANLAAVRMTAAGTVSLFAAGGRGAGMNTTGSSLAANDYAWIQTHGEVGGLDTETGITAVGYPVGVTDADGVTLADPTSGITWLGNSVCAVLHTQTGVAYLCGL